MREELLSFLCCYFSKHLKLYNAIKHQLQYHCSFGNYLASDRTLWNLIKPFDKGSIRQIVRDLQMMGLIEVAYRKQTRLITILDIEESFLAKILLFTGFDFEVSSNLLRQYLDGDMEIVILVEDGLKAVQEAKSEPPCDRPDRRAYRRMYFSQNIKEIECNVEVNTEKYESHVYALRFEQPLQALEIEMKRTKPKNSLVDRQNKELKKQMEKEEELLMKVQINERDYLPDAGLTGIAAEQNVLLKKKVALYDGWNQQCAKVKGLEKARCFLSAPQRQGLASLHSDMSAQMEKWLQDMGDDWLEAYQLALSRLNNNVCRGLVFDDFHATIRWLFDPTPRKGRGLDRLLNADYIESTPSIGDNKASETPKEEIEQLLAQSHMRMV